MINSANPPDVTRLWDMVGGPMPRGVLGLGDPDVHVIDGVPTMFLGGFSSSFRNRLYVAIIKTFPTSRRLRASRSGFAANGASAMTATSSLCERQRTFICDPQRPVANGTPAPDGPGAPQGVRRRPDGDRFLRGEGRSTST